MANDIRTPSPSRRLVAAGIKRGPAAWLVEQPVTTACDWCGQGGSGSDPIDPQDGE
jgi:hypothetical protein